MLEVSRYFQAVAQSQSHRVDILTRLASCPLLAHRDACLALTDLDTEVKQSLRVQPIESSTMFGQKFPDIIKQYEDELTHRSLQMAVGSNKQQQSSVPRKFPAKGSASSLH